MSEPACSSCGWDAEGCRSGNNPGTWRCDHQELSLIPFSHPWGEESSRSPSTQYWGLSLGTATPRLPLDLVPAFLSINPLGPCMKLCLPHLSSPLFLGLFLKLPFSRCVFFLHSFPTHVCSSHCTVLVYSLTHCCQHVQGNAGMRHYRYRRAVGGLVSFRQERCASPSSNLHENILLGIQEIG